MIIWRMRIKSRINKAINIRDYVIIIAFPLQQWLHESGSTLRYTYAARLVCLWDKQIEQKVPRSEMQDCRITCYFGRGNTFTMDCDDNGGGGGGGDYDVLFHALESDIFLWGRLC